ALEDGRTVRSGYNADLGGKLPNVGQSPTVDAHLIANDPLAHELLGEVLEGPADLLLPAGELLALGNADTFQRRCLQLVEPLLAVLLARDLQCLRELTGNGLLHGAVHVRLVRREDRVLLRLGTSGVRQLLLRLTQRADERLGRFQPLGDDAL